MEDINIGSVLVIGGGFDRALQIEKVLSQESFWGEAKVTWAPGVKSGIEQANELFPDVIILSSVLPDSFGNSTASLEVLKEIRPLSHEIIIFVTTRGKVEGKEDDHGVSLAFLLNGADCFLTRFDPWTQEARLPKAIRNVAKGRESQVNGLKIS